VYFAIALPVGLLGGLAAALLAEALSGTFATSDDVERRLGLPVLAALPAKP
jgi:capsular polysaccharide biosynthesis protein